MRDKLDEFDDQSNVEEVVETVESEFDPSLPPALQKTIDAVVACADALVAAKKFEADHYFGKALRKGEFNGSVTYNPSGDHVEGLYCYDNKLFDFFGYRGRTSLPNGDEAQVLFFRKGNDQQEIVLPSAVIAQGGAQLAAFLSSRGVYYPTHKGTREQAQKLLNVLDGPRVRYVGQPGWVGETMVYAHPLRIIGDTDKHPIVTDFSSAVNLKVAVKGTSEGSQKLLRLCAGNSRLLFSAGLAVASVLLRFVPHITPGLFHFFGQSSIGKSTMGLIGGSFWGGSDDLLGFGQSWNGTLNFHLKNAASHATMLYVLDEMRAGTHVTQAAYALGSGQDRNRLDKSSNQVKGSRLSAFTLSNGEVTLDEAERLNGGKHVAFNGAEVRAININADTGSGHGAFEQLHGYASGAAFSERLQHLARAHYGHVGLEFVDAVIAHVESQGRKKFEAWLSREIDEFVVSLSLPGQADDAVKRSAKMFGLVASAGALACDLDVFPLRRDDVLSGVRTCFHDWLTTRGGARSKTSSTALVALRDYINQHDGRFVEVDGDAKVSSLAGYKDEEYYYVLPHAWKEVLSTAPRAKLAEELFSLDLLKRQPSAKGDQVVKALPGNRQVRCYQISASIRGLRDDGTLDGVIRESDDTDNVVPHSTLQKMRKSLKSGTA